MFLEFRENEEKKNVMNDQQIFESDYEMFARKYRRERMGDKEIKGERGERERYSNFLVKVVLFNVGAH